MENWDVIVLGAGAAGMFCAIEAGRRGRRVLVVDHARAPGEKIRISGGGRCNFTNLGTVPERFISANPRFAASALKRFSQWDFIARLDAAGIAWHEKTLGQLFCDGSARQIVDMLVADMRDAGVVLRTGCAVGDLRKDGVDFVLYLAGQEARTPRLVVATGGKSIPKMGATPFGYQLAAQFGVPLRETRPGLVPLTFAPQELAWIAPLAGVSLPVRAWPETGPAFDEAVLFTHRGLSGPTILQISSYWREGQAVHLDLAPGRD
ncbi:MAG: aminoacetone oxidase family FAD-binding enzyme, partial [Luteolibacter sp.]